MGRRRREVLSLLLAPLGIAPLQSVPLGLGAFWLTPIVHEAGELVSVVGLATPPFRRFQANSATHSGTLSEVRNAEFENGRRRCREGWTRKVVQMLVAAEAHVGGAINHLPNSCILESERPQVFHGRGHRCGAAVDAVPFTAFVLVLFLLLQLAIASVGWRRIQDAAAFATAVMSETRGERIELRGGRPIGRGCKTRVSVVRCEAAAAAAPCGRRKVSRGNKSVRRAIVWDATPRWVPSAAVCRTWAVPRAAAILGVCFGDDRRVHERWKRRLTAAIPAFNNEHFWGFEIQYGAHQFSR
mmetsp:Transcript_65560/g.182246  ORF Transcript_65560/g.182246 Transcript_65560/m.182246 type:complete len:299 (+) Transcript_65560:837-1733(+)